MIEMRKEREDQVLQRGAETSSSSQFFLLVHSAVVGSCVRYDSDPNNSVGLYSESYRGWQCARDNGSSSFQSFVGIVVLFFYGVLCLRV
jgi:hypothetical protein